MEKLPDFSGKNILVIGDVMLDQYILGTVNRMSPEAPVPVLDKNKMELKAGGAANVALNIKALGAEPFLLSVIGKDQSGNELKKVLIEKEINVENLLESQGEMTTVKTRVIADKQHVIRIDEEDVSDISDELESRVLASFHNIIDQVNIHAILIEDYNKGLLTSSLISRIIEVSKSEKIFISVDPKFRNFEFYKSVDLLKPNFKEVNHYLKANFSMVEEDLSKAVNMVHDQMQYRNLLITLGEKGIYIHDSVNGTKLLVPTRSLDIVDVCGAGDAVISLATLCLVSGFSLENTASWSNKAGAHVCQNLGVTTVSLRNL